MPNQKTLSRAGLLGLSPVKMEFGRVGGEIKRLIA